MSDKKTRLEKVQSENRKLKQENDELKIVNKELREKLVVISKNEEKKNKYSTIKEVFLFIYDIVVSALILAFVYWRSVNNYEQFDMPYTFFVVLFVLICLKCFFKDKEFCINSTLSIIFNDLIKPAISMLIGLLLCIFCLGKEWKMTESFALDATVTMVLVVFVAIIVLVVVLVGHFVIKFFDKKRAMNKRK